MDKPALIAELETALGFSLNDLTGQEALWKVIEHLAFIDACMAGRESATAADLERAALERLNMSVCRNCYLCDADGAVIGLNLFGNDLAQLPVPEHPGWRRLRVLNLAENKLTELALPAGWQALQSLDLGDNQTLRALRFDGPLPALERLDASDSGLEHLVVPAGMSALKHLDVSRNKLRSVVFEGDCAALEWLDFSGNGLEGFRLSKGFDALQYLYLNNNALKSLVFDAPLVNLNTLHLSKNQLDELPGNLFLFDKLESLYLHNNPLPAVPKGASGVPEGEHDNAAVAIRNYLRSIIEDAPMPIDEVKLVLIGNSTAGKSSLIRYLIDGVYDETIPSTHGISNIIWDSNELGFKVNIWDFGGQEFYHATHRLFLTENALSLVVLNLERTRQASRNWR
ncbi:MAG: hypothetical protein IPM36_04335 [Lewinellaceae bacterium]|nr:hypothetical protein [Lewinellaceae bacterium]